MLGSFLKTTIKYDTMKNKSLVSINDFNKDEILRIIELAADFEANPNQPLLRDKVIASIIPKLKSTKSQIEKYKIPN